MFELLGIKPVVSATDLILRLIEHEVPEYGLVHLLDLPEERLEIIEMLLGEDSPVAGRRVGDLRDAGGQPADLGAARGQGVRARARTRCWRPATRCSPCSIPGLEEDLKALLRPGRRGGGVSGCA